MTHRCATCRQPGAVLGLRWPGQYTRLPETHRRYGWAHPGECMAALEARLERAMNPRSDEQMEMAL